MPAEVIETVHQLAAACKKYKGIEFTDKDGNIINNDSNEDDNDTLEITGVDTTNIDDMTTGVDTTTINIYDTTTGVDTMNNDDTFTGVYNNIENTETTTENQDENTEHNIAPHTENEQYDAGHNQDEIYDQYDDDVSIEDGAPEDIHITINDMNTIHEMNWGQLYIDPNTGETMEEENDTPTHRYNLRPRPTTRNKKYNMMNIGQQSTIAKPHLHVILNQVGIREGLKRFGEKGNNALLKELNQLHERDALLPKKKEDMTYDERRKALRYLMFLKEKRDETIKARGCADGRSQREYMTKAETSSPTMSLEAMMMSCTIDAREGRHVAVTDIPGAFLHADMEDDVHMLLEGTIAELVVKLDPSLYRKYIWENEARETNAICKTEESTIRNTTSSTSILATTFRHLDRMGVQTK